MREIKFRAWVSSDSTMIQHREVVERAHLQFDDSLNHTDIVMQYTGLKDKNGVEIYEGDIVSVNGYVKEVKYQIQGKNTYGHGECSFNIYAGFSFGYWGNYEDAEVEVIGNIYENP